jgi:hypothetical protein
MSHLDAYIHGDYDKVSALRRHLEQHPRHASGLFRFFLLACYPRHEWGSLTRTESAYVRVLAGFLVGADKVEAVALHRRVEEWYRVRCCEHCGIFHGDIGLRFCERCFDGELLTGERKHYLHAVKMTARQRRQAAAQLQRQ